MSESGTGGGSGSSQAASGGRRKLVGRVPRSSLANGQVVRLPYPPFDALVAELEDGTYAAIEDACNHAGASLAEGPRMPGGRIVCPMHAYVFDLRTGHLLRPRGLCGPQRTFETSVDDSEVTVWDSFKLDLLKGV